MSFDAYQFLNDFHIDYTDSGPHSSHGWVNINCPYPGCKDDNYHGGFNLQEGYYHCWKCGGHPLDKIIHFLLGVKYEEAERIKWQYTGRFLQLKILNKKIKSVSSIELPGEKLGKKHREYLRSRGFSPQKIEQLYHISGTNWASAGFKNRIIIPVFSHGKLVSYLGRDITGENPLRYKGLSPEESIIHYKRLLYGFDECISSLGGLVEGPFDQWRMGPGFVCSFGTALTEYQIKLLSSFDKLFILFDPEPFTQRKVKKLASRLASLGTKVELIQWGNDKDPAEFSETEAKEIRNDLGFTRVYKPLQISGLRGKR